MKQFNTIPVLLCTLVCSACDRFPFDDNTQPPLVDVEEIAQILSEANLTGARLSEVHDAVSESVGNGYDEEYTMSSLFASPGSGVGRDKLTKAALEAEGVKSSYSDPLRNVFIEHFSTPTKAGGSITAQDYLDYISRSDMQIYWPYSSSWDGVSRPVITFDPFDASEAVEGWYMNDDGCVQSVMVTEELARNRPVWVINNNDDSRHTTVDILRKNNPDWAAGGTVVIGGGSKSSCPVPLAAAAAMPVKSLILQDITLMRPYDNWLQGASEIFFKIGAVESFNAKIQEDMYLYNPSITDFMVVVRRSDVGQKHELNTLLVSEWTSQLQNCAFMIVEDDGGKITNWTCSAMVKVNSKSYGFEMNIPYRDRDDIVWRGQLSRRYIEATSHISGNFGDVQVTFGIEEL